MSGGILRPRFSPAGSALATLIVSSVTTFLLPLDYTVVSVALRDIHHDFPLGFSDQQWVINGYTMAFAALLMAGGGLADLYGRKKVFLAGLGLFTAASLLAGLAPSAAWLNAGRVAQGVGAAGMFSSSLALLVREFTGHRRTRAFAVFGVASGLGASLGPFIGGLVTGLGGWRWAFLLNVPLGAAMLVLGLLGVRESRDPGATRLDRAGLALFSGAVLLAVHALVTAPVDGWTDPAVLGGFAGAAVLLAAFVPVELRRRSPLMDVRLFAGATFLAASAVPLVLSVAFWGLFLTTPLYFQGVLGYSPLEAGAAMLPFAVPLFGAGPLGARLAAVLPSRALLALGQLLVALGAGLLALAPTGCQWTGFAPGGLVAGLGTGLINGEMSNIALGLVPADRSGMASGINSTMRIVGMTAGFGGAGAVVSAVVARSRELAAYPSWTHARVAAGDIGAVAAALPAPARHAFRAAAEQAFASGLRAACVLGAAVALAGAAGSWLLIRPASAPAVPVSGSAPRCGSSSTTSAAPEPSRRGSSPTCP